MNIQEIRQQYPQYNDLPDTQLAQGLHQKFYSDMPFDEFSKKIGLVSEISLPEQNSTKGIEERNQKLEATLAAEPTKNNWAENLGRGLVQGSKDVVMGGLQTGADVLGAVFPENKTIQDIRELAPEAQASSNIAYQAATGDSTAAGIGRVGGQIAGYSIMPGGVVAQGAMAGALQPTEQQKTVGDALIDRAESAAVGGAAGYIAPKVVGAAAGGAKLALGAVGEKLGVLAPKELPPGLGNLDSLIKAGRSSIFAKDPNSLDLGLKANYNISENFDKAKSLQAQAFTIAHESGNFTLKAPSVYNKLDEIINAYEGKVAVGSKEQAALGRLSEIKTNMADKYGGENIASASDLMDIEQAISSGLPVNKFFKAGDAKLYGFQQDVKGTLKRAGEANPEFGQNYKNAKELSREVASKYTNNKSLKSIWQPEDHTAWKAHQNNPNDFPNPYSNATLSRAQKTLTNLNTKETGKIKAVLDVLPQKQRDELMRAAVVKARQDDISMTSAFTSLVHAHPITAAVKAFKTLTGNGKRVNLDEVGADLQRMKKRK